MVKCTLYITHCLRLNLQLHTIDLVRTCRISSFCTVAWQLARFNWYDASRGPSAIAELLVIVIGPPSAAQSAAELRWAYKMLLFSFLTNWTYQTDLHHRLQKYMKLSILRKFLDFTGLYFRYFPTPNFVYDVVRCSHVVQFRLTTARKDRIRKCLW